LLSLYTPTTVTEHRSSAAVNFACHHAPASSPTVNRNCNSKLASHETFAWCIIFFPMKVDHGVTCLTMQGIKYSLPQVPSSVAAASHQLQALAVPAAVVQIAAKLWRLRLIRQRRRRKPAKSTAASQGMLIRSSLDLSAKACMLRHISS